MQAKRARPDIINANANANANASGNAKGTDTDHDDKNASYPPVKRTHTELNVSNVVLGNLLVKPWYPSFYPKELVGQRTERLYVCQWCFKYSKELVPYVSHLVRRSAF